MKSNFFQIYFLEFLFYSKISLLETEYRIKHLYLSHRTDSSIVLRKSLVSHDNDINDKSSKNFLITESINERLYINFTDTCPLFLLKEGIDHRFEFLDFAPDLYIRQRFHSLNQNEFILNNTDRQLFSKQNSQQQTTEIEYKSNILFFFFKKGKEKILSSLRYNQRNCRCNYLLVEIYRLLIKLWDQSSNIEKVLYYSLELASVELTRTNYYESKIILQNILEHLEKERNHLNLPTFFEPQIYDLLSGSI